MSRIGYKKQLSDGYNRAGTSPAPTFIRWGLLYNSKQVLAQLLVTRI